MSRFEVALAGVLPVAGTARALDITSCGVLVPPGEIGDLQADLSCPATSGSASVILPCRAPPAPSAHLPPAMHTVALCPHAASTAARWAGTRPCT